MGCPDTVKANCPSCSKPVWFQSKGGPNACKSFELNGDVPLDVLSDVNRHSPINCQNCNALLFMNYQKGQFFVDEYVNQKIKFKKQY